MRRRFARHRLLPLLPLLWLGCARGVDLDLTPPPATPLVDAGHLLYQAELEPGEGRRRFRLALAVHRPGRFRLEVLGPVGGPRIIVASDGARVQAALPPRKLYADGPAGPDALQALLGLPLAPDDFLTLLTGAPELPGGPGDGEPLERRRKLADGRGVRLRYWAASGGGARRAELHVDGETEAYVAEYAARGPSPWGSLPHQVELRHGTRRLSLTLKRSSRGRPPEAAFLLAPPAHFRRVALGELSGLGEALFDPGG